MDWIWILQTFTGILNRSSKEMSEQVNEAMITSSMAVWDICWQSKSRTQEGGVTWSKHLKVIVHFNQGRNHVTQNTTHHQGIQTHQEIQTHYRNQRWELQSWGLHRHDQRGMTQPWTERVRDNVYKRGDNRWDAQLETTDIKDRRKHHTIAIEQ